MPRVTTRPEATGRGTVLRVEMRGGHLTLVGDADASTAPMIVDAVSHTLETGMPWILVDLSGLTMLDAAGVRALVDAQNLAATDGVLLRVHHPSAVARRVLGVVGELSRLTWG